MIVADNKPSLSSKMDNGDNRSVVGDRELPPPYAGTRDNSAAVPVAEASTSAVILSSSSSQTIVPVSPPQKPASNFVIVKRTNSGIAESYVIDTQLHIPEGLISPIAEGSEDVYADGLISGERPHIYLESTHGSVSADIWLIRGRGGSPPGQDAKTDKHITDDRALVNVKSSHSSVNTKLYCDTEQPYILCASSKYGSVNVWLPSNFVGPATITTSYGKVVLSTALQERCTTFSEINNVRTCFIGDYGAAGFRSLNEWKGSILQLSTYNGKVRVGFVDELAPTPAACSGSGFSWSKMFSWK